LATLSFDGGGAGCQSTGQRANGFKIAMGDARRVRSTVEPQRSALPGQILFETIDYAAKRQLFGHRRRSATHAGGHLLAMRSR